MTKAQRELLQIARSAIEAALKKQIFVSSPQCRENLKKQGVFVTLTQKGQLQGCIGLIESADPLFKTTAEMAVSAALHDDRFHPLTQEQLPSISIEISVLSPLQKVKDIKEITVGTHGVVVKQAGRRGLFLPQVALKTGWGRETLLSMLCSEKMGLAEDAWLKPGTEIYIFTVESFEEHPE